MNLYFYLSCLILFKFLPLICALKSNSICELPGGCRFKIFHILSTISASEHVSWSNEKGLFCEIRDMNFQYDFDSWLLKNQSEVCRQAQFRSSIELKVNSRKNILIESSFNLQGVIDFLLQIETQFTIRISFAKRISADLAIQMNKYWHSPVWSSYGTATVELVNSKLDFYVSSHQLARSCQDYVDAYLTYPRSIFQIYLYYYTQLTFLNCIYKHPLCPLLFRYARINVLTISGMSDNFFRKNTLLFTGSENNSLLDTLDSYIYGLVLYRTENIAIDANFLNPFVFKHLSYINCYEPIGRIDNNIFSFFRELKYLQLEAHFFRKLVHKQGIDWIRSINRHVSVNLSDSREIKRNQNNEHFLILRFTDGHSIRDVLLDDDFCLFVKFPFEQLVVFQFSVEILNSPSDILNFIDFDSNHWTHRLSCTAWWLIQYFPFIRDVYKNNHDNVGIPPSSVPETCNLPRMLDRCNKTLWVIYLTGLSNCLALRGIFNFFTLTNRKETDFIPKFS